MGANDYAIVIGIAGYQHYSYVREIREATDAFLDWLLAPDGGDVPLDHVADAGGELLTIDSLFEELLHRAHDCRRLYVYVSGIGLAQGEDLALLPIDFDPGKSHQAISIDACAKAAHSYAAEVIVFADILRTPLTREVTLFTPKWKPGKLRNTAFFHAFSFGPPVFTRALIEGLNGAAADSKRAVTAESLMGYLSESLHGSPARSASNGLLVIVPPPTPADRVTTHPDDPAIVDELGRRPFAEVLGKRIEEVRALQETRENDLTFMIHLHGPWGSGKTSVLNFLRSYLEQRDWVVVEFNAWRHQRMRPPWWALIQSIYSDASRNKHTSGLAFKWWLWRFWADLTPALITIALLLATFSFIVSGLQGPQDFELAPKLLLAVAAAGGAIWTYSRSLIFGSARAAQTYTELRSDPLAPIVELFRRLIKSIKRPVVVFIDDLDRCDSKFVIELLEGIQTLFRSAPVTYVVAADRKWIRSSFDQTYEHFGTTIGEPGRPLGYLFLEKVFQVSASVPRLSEEVQGEYWKILLRGDGVDPKTLDRQRQSAEEAAATAVKGAKTHEELDAKIAAEQRPLEKAAMRAAAAKQIVSPEARKETEHRLQPFAGLLEPNPRAMKRLVNAYGLHQASNFLEGRDVPASALARWTIVELRWPLLADYLAMRPEHAKTFATGILSSEVPVALQPLFFDDEVRAAAGYVPPDAHLLDEATIRGITGR